MIVPSGRKRPEGKRGRGYPATVSSAVPPVPSVREAIIEATTELIRTKGVAGTSISDIVARSGTSAGAIYHHFGSKERLVLEVGKNIIARPMEMVLSTNPDLSPTRLFEAALSQVARDHTTPELLLQIWAGAKSDPELGRLIQGHATTVRVTVRTIMAAWCADNSPTTDPEDLVDLVLGLVMGYAVLRAMSFDRPPDAYEEFAKRLVETAVSGQSPAPVEAQRAD